MYRPHEFIPMNMHSRNRVFRHLITNEYNNSATLHNKKTHTKDQNKNMRDDHTYLGMSSIYAQANNMDDVMTNNFDDSVQTSNLAIVS